MKNYKLGKYFNLANFNENLRYFQKKILDFLEFFEKKFGQKLRNIRSVHFWGFERGAPEASVFIKNFRKPNGTLQFLKTFLNYERNFDFQKLI